MLDTNVISDLVRNPQGRAAKRIAKAGEDSVCTSIIVAAELRYGCAKSGSARLLKAVDDVLAEIEVLASMCRLMQLMAESALSWKASEGLSGTTTC